MKTTRYIFSLLLLMNQVAAFGQTPFSTSELEARRKAALERVPDGIILLRSYSGLKHWDESGFHQDSSFYYFTVWPTFTAPFWRWMGNRRNHSCLSLPDRVLLEPSCAHGIPPLDPGAQTEKELKIDHVAPSDQFVSFIESRQKNNTKLVLYTDSAAQTGRMSGEASVPQGLDPMENSHSVWADMLHRHWADLEVKDAFAILDEVRSVKSTAELARLRQAAAATEKGFWAGVNAISPGRTQRQVEGRVLDACLEAGSDGPSLWPWVRSGPNTMGNTLFEALADYHNMDRRMQAGEVVRLDVGCDFDMYKGDFGRTIPVSGRFDEGQRETMELLNGAYPAGVNAMRPGATPKDVYKATPAGVSTAGGTSDLAAAQATSMHSDAGATITMEASRGLKWNTPKTAYPSIDLITQA